MKMNKMFEHTFRRSQTLRELLKIASLVLFPEVKKLDMYWSTLRINLGQDLGFSGSAFWSIVDWSTQET